METVDSILAEAAAVSRLPGMSVDEALAHFKAMHALGLVQIKIGRRFTYIRLRDPRTGEYACWRRDERRRRWQQ